MKYQMLELRVWIRRGSHEKNHLPRFLPGEKKVFPSLSAKEFIRKLSTPHCSGYRESGEIYEELGGSQEKYPSGRYRDVVDAWVSMEGLVDV